MAYRRPLKKPAARPVVDQPVIITDEYTNSIRAHAYIGKKGYTIPRSILSEEDIAFLHKDLFVKPFVPGVNYGGTQTDLASAFPVYRENQNKLYLPRFYGIHRYGIPDKNEVEPGEDIDVVFDKTLRDYQDKIVGVYIDYTNTPVSANTAVLGGGGILEVPCGRGKTVMALKIISLLRKKTLIIVHKEFLMNQWIDRIAEFLPGARVGKIQGPTFDVDGKDIVIGMVQTLYDKEYPSDAFSCFGLTIIDEVHRIGSEQFSRTLFKTITPYMLGISATVDRKDKLTRVLHMFIGDKIYEEARENDDQVCVRGIQYICNNSEFNETEVDFRGNTKYSSMITKLCAFGPRSDFIVRVLTDLRIEQETSQIMVLCHNRSLLTYLHDSIVHKQFASVGYYVGGMKQAKLLETESKQIVLATYAMAAEALDIKTLSTLVMVTPKTDIIQSVGRILRVKHKNPIVVDIIDAHDIFQRQWMQRRRFYKKCQYHIRQIDSTKYNSMSLNWSTDLTWKRVFEPSLTITSDDPSDDASDDGDASENKPASSRKCLIALDDM
jgi:superfamily II DNA or RNA helicase